MIVDCKKIFIDPFGGDRESAGEVGCNPMLWINDLGEEIFGSILYLFYSRFILLDGIWCLVRLNIFLDCRMWSLAVSVEGGRCLVIR